MQKLFFDTELQLIIFHVILNKSKGIIINEICKQIQRPKTTVYENMVKMEKRKLSVGPEFKNIPYIKHYQKILRPGKRGRPNIIWYVPKSIRNTFINVYFPEIEIGGNK